MNDVLIHTLPDLHNEVPADQVPVQRVGHRGVMRTLVLDGDEPMTAEIDVYVGLGPGQRGAHMSRLIDVLPNARRVDTLHDYVLAARDDLKAATPESIFWEVVARGTRLHDTDDGYKPVIEEYRADARVVGSGVVETLSAYAGLKVCLVCPQAQAVIAHMQTSTAVEAHPSHNQLCELSVGVQNVDARELVEFAGVTFAMAEAAMSGRVRERYKRLGEGRAVAQAHARPRFAEDALRDLALSLSRRFPTAARVSSEIVSFESIFEYPLVCRVEV